MQGQLLRTHRQAHIQLLASRNSQCTMPCAFEAPQPARPAEPVRLASPGKPRDVSPAAQPSLTPNTPPLPHQSPP